jgi:hypothetical protein
METTTQSVDVSIERSFVGYNGFASAIQTRLLSFKLDRNMLYLPLRNGIYGEFLRSKVMLRLAGRLEFDENQVFK